MVLLNILVAVRPVVETLGISTLLFALLASVVLFLTSRVDATTASSAEECYVHDCMRPVLRTTTSVLLVLIVVLAVAGMFRVVRVTRAGAAIPVYPGARESGGRTRYLPHLISWDDRSSARIQRIFAFPNVTPLTTIARHADAKLSTQGWYLVAPEDLERVGDPQVIVWQRDPDERLDLMKVWPLPNLTRTQRLYGGIFPAEFLDAPLVIEWSWALGGARSPRYTRQELIQVRTPPPPPTPGP